MHPLEGIRVVDLTTMINGPVAAMLLSDMGAEVIKIEPPDGDPGGPCWAVSWLITGARGPLPST